MGGSCSLPDGSELKGPEERVAHEVNVRANIALVFVKPHACTTEGVKFVRKELAEKVCILGECPMSGDALKAGNVMDQHYAAIAKNSLQVDPAELTVSDEAKEKFSQIFRMEWDAALEDHCVLNAQDCAVKLGTSDDDPLPAKDLFQLWKLAPEKVKVAPGAYVAKVRGAQPKNDEDFGGEEDNGEDPLFVVNGFYPALKANFENSDAQIHLFVVAFDPCVLPWADFRRDVIGATNPEKASESSLRAKILRDYQNLNLKEPPDNTDNGVHGSAGPLEALKERLLWLNFPLEKDPTGAKLLELAVWDESKQSVLKDLLDNPLLDAPGLHGRAFDLTEDRDTPDLFALANNLAFQSDLAGLVPAD